MVAFDEMQVAIQPTKEQGVARKKIKKSCSLANRVGAVVFIAADDWATGCNSRAGEARGAGSESPTVLPENEDGSAGRRPAISDRPTDGSEARQMLPLPLGLWS